MLRKSSNTPNCVRRGLLEERKKVGNCPIYFEGGYKDHPELLFLKGKLKEEEKKECSCKTAHFCSSQAETLNFCGCYFGDYCYDADICILTCHVCLEIDRLEDEIIDFKQTPIASTHVATLVSTKGAKRDGRNWNALPKRARLKGRELKKFKASRKVVVETY